jgi:hypothetical protein
MLSASEIRSTTRQAGIVYLLMSVLAMLDYFYLGGLFQVAGDPAATAANILARESLYRVSLLLALTTQVLFTVVVLLLYRLFRDVDLAQARLMLALVGIGIVVQCGSIVFDFTPLVLLKGASWLAVFSRDQLQALAFAALQLHARQGALLTVFWGLWLFPFAILTFRCGFLPRFLAVLLLLSGAAYLVASVAGIVLPEQVSRLRPLLMPLYFGEFVVVLWLAFVGARPRAGHAPGAG